MSKGWRGESSRHAMARMGIKTGTKKVSTYNVPKRDGSGKGVRVNVGRNPNCATPKSKKVINVSPASEEQYLRNKIKFVGGYSPAEAEGIIYLITKKHKSEKEVFAMTKLDLEIASWNTPKGEWLQFDGQEVWTNALGKKFGERVCIGFDETGYFHDGKHYPMPSKKIRKEIMEEKFTAELGSPAQRRKDLEEEFGIRK